MEHLERFDYGYDNANELTGVTENGTPVGTYTYDSNGNQTGTGYSTGTENEQTASPGYTYTYDNAGNLISQTNTSTHVVTTYTYDYRNRLTEVTQGGTVIATYTYDVLNRRIGIKDSGTQTWTVYDGTSADAQPYADFNGSGSLTERYLTGSGVVNGAVVGQLLARTNASGTTDWYLTDKLGSVRDIVSTSGTELDHIVYDSFGNIVTETHASNGDRFKYAGMEYDATVGQYYDRAHYYDEATGRFMGEEPEGFAAGSMDLFEYVGNGPTDGVDPNGMETEQEALEQASAYYQSMQGGQPSSAPTGSPMNQNAPGNPATTPSRVVQPAGGQDPYGRYGMRITSMKDITSTNPLAPQVFEVKGVVWWLARGSRKSPQLPPAPQFLSWSIIDANGKVVMSGKIQPSDPPDMSFVIDEDPRDPPGAFRIGGGTFDFTIPGEGYAHPAKLVVQAIIVTARPGDLGENIPRQRVAASATRFIPL